VGVSVAKLRINDIPASAGRGRRVEVTWDDGRAAPRVAVTEFDAMPDTGDGERIRWYLEDYAEFPADPASALAQAAEARLAQAGEDLFRRVFSSNDAVGIWERARDMLSEVRIEVDIDPDSGPGLAWELLRDPELDAALALSSAAFVRTHRQAAGHPDLPEPSGDRLRVLLVICRPGGREDVPFRSVASRLVRGGADQIEGLDLDVLRPATFARLSKVLRAAHAAGSPYHVVHFDGHGSYVDLTDLGFRPDGGGGGSAVLLTPHMYGISVAGSVRRGQHGYLIFEDPDSEGNQQLVDGPALGRLLTATGVPVLVLNACRSAYTEARDQPGGAPPTAPGETGIGEAAAGAEASLTGDVHSRIRAYGSLASEVADIGVPGVVAMRYNVYVVTAAQYMADLYAHMLAGKSLGQAATAARQALAADPVRQIGAIPVSLQDWAVPVVYEAALLELLRPPERTAPLIKLDPSESGDGGATRPGALPRPPDAGFFGRDETLLALDRAFDSKRIVLLHAYAGAGKSSTAAEFARWYQATGGLDLPDQPDLPGAVLWSSFEHHLTADRVIGTVGDYFAPLLEANGIHWQAVTNPGQRRNYVIQVLAQLPVLWIWDNVEPVTGFPANTRSDWAQSEQDDLLELLRDLAQRTRCKVLLTSRRDEHGWLGNLPVRVQLPGMPMRESLQLAFALAERYAQVPAGIDWRPLLRYAAGNPLTVTVLVGQALRENLTTTGEIEQFVARLHAGEAQFEAGEDAALGRTHSLAASLSYGFAQAFSDTERAKLAVLHLFRDAVFVGVLVAMGDSEIAREDAVPVLAGLSHDASVRLLDRAADIGLLTSLGSDYYQIHPALPWYFSTLFTKAHGQARDAPARSASRAYVRAIGDYGNYLWGLSASGQEAVVIGFLRSEEANLLQALDEARRAELWSSAVGCLQGLRVLYERTGRDGEWARLVTEITPDFTDPVTGGPLAGREEEWNIVTDQRVSLAKAARDMHAAAALIDARIKWVRARAAEALSLPATSLNDRQRWNIRSLVTAIAALGNLLLEQEDAGCLAHFQEGFTLAQQIDDRSLEADLAGCLGNAYMISEVTNLDQAEHWFRHSLDLRADSDGLGKVLSLGSLGRVAYKRFSAGRASGEADSVLLGYLNTALYWFQQGRDLTPSDDHNRLGISEALLGNVYAAAGDARQSLHHYQQAIQHQEATGNVFGAGQTRENVAALLAAENRTSEALSYARAALANFQQLGPGARPEASKAGRFVAELEQELKSASKAEGR
jgi:tetratricopeptide (TPR) repeat protein